jgi:hypothetical protein
MKHLNLNTKTLRVVKVTVSDVDIAEVTILDDWNNQKRGQLTCITKNALAGSGRWQGSPANMLLHGYCPTEGSKLKILCMSIT